MNQGSKHVYHNGKQITMRVQVNETVCDQLHKQQGPVGQGGRAPLDRFEYAPYQREAKLEAVESALVAADVDQIAFSCQRHQL